MLERVYSGSQFQRQEKKRERERERKADRTGTVSDGVGFPYMILFYFLQQIAAFIQKNFHLQKHPHEVRSGTKWPGDLRPTYSAER